jgi:hypothetical protein
MDIIQNSVRFILERLKVINLSQRIIRFYK